jgi:hypothetical protein
VNEVCDITGTVTINMTTGSNDKFNRQVMFQGCQITGTINDTSSREHTVLIQDCYLYSNTRAFYQNSTVDCRTRIQNCEIKNDVSSNSTLALLHMSQGDCYLDSLTCTYSNPGSVILADASGVVFANMCNFINSSASVAAPGIKIAYITNTRSSTFGFCTFQFTSTATKTNANGFWCVRYEPPVSSSGIALGYCSFAPAGMNSSQSVAGSNGTQTPVFAAPIIYGACLATPGGASTIAGSLTTTPPGLQKIQFTVVV